MRKILMAAALLVAIGSASAGLAATKQYLTVSPLQLSPNDRTDFDGNSYANVDAFSSHSPVQACWGTGLNFPKGIKVTSLYVYLTSDTTSNLYVHLTRKDMRTGNYQALTSGEPITHNGNTYVFAILPITSYNRIDNGTYIFQMEVCLRSGTQFHGAILEYTVP